MVPVTAGGGTGCETTVGCGRGNVVLVVVVDVLVVVRAVAVVARVVVVTLVVVGVPLADALHPASNIAKSTPHRIPRIRCGVTSTIF